jgi:hypothetical protein
MFIPNSSGPAVARQNLPGKGQLLQSTAKPLDAKDRTKVRHPTVVDVPHSSYKSKLKS